MQAREHVRDGEADCRQFFDTLGTFATEIAKNGAPQGVMIGTTAIARGTFGSGRVFCFSPHPERTEAAQDYVFKAIHWAAKK